jgi:cytochrome c2
MNSLSVIRRRMVILAFVCGSLPTLAQTDTLASFISGRTLFNTSCRPCHGVHREIIGPMLASIPKKHTKKWLGKFIRNSQEVILSGDAYGSELFEHYHHQVMPSFTRFSDREINNLLLYIESESIHPAETVNIDDDVMQNGGDHIIHGKVLFQDQCLTCHHVGDETFGPALGSVTKRHSAAWLSHFIRHSAEVIDSGDPYATNLFKNYNHKPMIDLEFLSDDDIESILAYIEFASSSVSAQGGVNGRKVVSGRDVRSIRSVECNAESGNLFKWLILAPGIAGVLILLFLATLLVKEAAQEKTGVI